MNHLVSLPCFAVAERAPKQGGEGLSVQTLVIAATAAGCAAVVTSYFWQRGTLVSAAMTPVIVTVVSEMLKRPARKVSRSVSAVRSSSSVRESVPLAHGAGAGPPVEGPSRELPAPPEPTPARFSEIKVYKSEGAGERRFGRIHWKVVGATAAIAFVIAVGALTLPELLFGSSVTGSRQTTFFGGSDKRSKHDETKTTTDQQKTTTEPQQTVTTTAPTDTATVQQQTTPAQPPPQQAAPPQSPQPTAPAPQQAPQTPSP